jgi:hypothetical protein
MDSILNGGLGDISNSSLENNSLLVPVKIQINVWVVALASHLLVGSGETGNGSGRTL